jgi:hypothetical protein
MRPMHLYIQIEGISRECEGDQNNRPEIYWTFNIEYTASLLITFEPTGLERSR